MKPERSEIEYDSTRNRKITFRARRKSDGEIVYGNYNLLTRKKSGHFITTRDDNTDHEVYRESLQLQNWEGEWENI